MTHSEAHAARHVLRNRSMNRHLVFMALALIVSWAGAALVLWSLG